MARIPTIITFLAPRSTCCRPPATTRSTSTLAFTISRPRIPLIPFQRTRMLISLEPHSSFRRNRPSTSVALRSTTTSTAATTRGLPGSHKNTRDLFIPIPILLPGRIVLLDHANHLLCSCTCCKLRNPPLDPIRH